MEEPDYFDDIHLDKTEKFWLSNVEQLVFLRSAIHFQGCRFVPYTCSETIRHRWYLPLDLNIGVSPGFGSFDPGPNLQPWCNFSKFNSKMPPESLEWLGSWKPTIRLPFWEPFRSRDSGAKNPKLSWLTWRQWRQVSWNLGSQNAYRFHQFPTVDGKTYWSWYLVNIPSCKGCLCNVWDGFTSFNHLSIEQKLVYFTG